MPLSLLVNLSRWNSKSQPQRKTAPVAVCVRWQVVGQKVTDRTLEELAQEFQGFEPPLQPKLQRIPVSEEDDAALEMPLIQVEPAAQAPYFSRCAL